MQHFSSHESTQGILELLKSVVIDLIQGYSSSNTKLRLQSEAVFGKVFDLLGTIGALPHLFQMLLVGFAGNKSSTISATIRALMLLLKVNYVKKGINVGDPQFQDFLKKVSKIVSLFLKDEKAETELHRASLKFLKTSVAFLSPANLQGELAEHILTQGVFALPPQKRSKHLALLRKLVGKFLKKLGPIQLKRVTPHKHHALIEYVEKARRRLENKKKKAKLMALLGKTEEAPKSGKPNTEGIDSDSDDEMDSGDEEQQFGTGAEEHYSNEGSDDSDDEFSSDEEDNT